MRRIAFAVVLIGAVLPLKDAIAAPPYLMTEAVSNYGGSANIPNAIPNAAGFRSGMTGWTTLASWTDSNVIDSDFVDPQLRTGGADTSQFDDTGNLSISYFSGHGTCDAGFPGGCQGGSVQVCNQASDCPASANPYTYAPGAGVCRYWPGGSTGPGFGYCAYASPRFILTNSGSSIYGNAVEYSNVVNVSSAWGESSNSGTWRGAGTNGGTNLVVLDLSNGMSWPFAWQGLSSAFAGVHMIATLAPTAGDTAMVSDRGAFFAAKWNANHSSSVMTSWLNTMSSMPSEGAACGASPYTSGGYQGFNGCGCNVAMVVGATNAEAISHVNESWNNIQDHTLDAQGANYYYWYGQCNYNTTTYPITLP